MRALEEMKATFSNYKTVFTVLLSLFLLISGGIHTVAEEETMPEEEIQTTPENTSEEEPSENNTSSSESAEPDEPVEEAIPPYITSLINGEEITHLSSRNDTFIITVSVNIPNKCDYISITNYADYPIKIDFDNIQSYVLDDAESSGTQIDGIIDIYDNSENHINVIVSNVTQYWGKTISLVLSGTIPENYPLSPYYTNNQYELTNYSYVYYSFDASSEFIETTSKLIVPYDKMHPELAMQIDWLDIQDPQYRPQKVTITIMNQGEKLGSVDMSNQLETFVLTFDVDQNNNLVLISDTAWFAYVKNTKFEMVDENGNIIQYDIVQEPIEHYNLERSGIVLQEDGSILYYLVNRLINEEVANQISPTNTAVKVGRTCQDDGYPEGYDWSDDAQACIVSNNSINQTNKIPLPNTSVN